MQVIVIGCGKVGSSLARELLSNDHTVVIIENDKKLLSNADDLDCIKINGVPIDKDVLKNAGIEQADAVCAVTSDDNMNLMTAQVAREIFKVNKVIARIFNPESNDLFEEFGMDTICSTTLSVNAIIRALEEQEDEISVRILGTDVVCSSTDIENSYLGKEIFELSKDIGKHIIGIFRNGEMILAMSGMRVEKGDKLVLMSTNNDSRGKQK